MLVLYDYDDSGTDLVPCVSDSQATRGPFHSDRALWLDANVPA